MTEPFAQAPAAAAVPTASPAAPAAARRVPWAWLILLAATLLAMGVAWQTQQRVITLEQELVRRQQGVADQVGEARLMAKQAQDTARDTAARTALLDARVAEVALQRGQLEDLILSLSRSRDENLVTDIEAAVRVALQQTAITGSAEPLVAALRSADDRLTRVNNPRLEAVRRAIARDLDRVRSVGVADIASLLIKIDEVVHLVDDLPLLSVAVVAPAASAPSAGASGAARGTARARAAAGAVAASAAASGADAAAAEPAFSWADWRAWLMLARQPAQDLWTGLRTLVRVTRIDDPDTMLIAPEQSFFLRENLKLRLLNARLALLSRQFDTAQGDLQVARAAVARYFDGSSRRTAVALEILRQAVSQGRMSAVPRPDDTLAALTAAAAGK